MLEDWGLPCSRGGRTRRTAPRRLTRRTAQRHPEEDPASHRARLALLRLRGRCHHGCLKQPTKNSLTPPTRRLLRDHPEGPEPDIKGWFVDSVASQKRFGRLYVNKHVQACPGYVSSDVPANGCQARALGYHTLAGRARSPTPF